MSVPREVSWPLDRLGEALESLARHCRLPIRDSGLEATPVVPAGLADKELDRWIEATVSRLGLETQAAEAPYAEVEALLTGAGPALLRLPGEENASFLALIASAGKRLVVLARDRSMVRLPREAVRAALCHETEKQVAADVERILTDAAVTPARRPRAQRALLRGLLGRTGVGGCWLLRPGTTNSLAQAREAGLLRLLLITLTAQAVETLLWMLSWWLLGWMTLEDRLEPGWLGIWALLLGTLIPFRLLALGAGGRLTVRAGALFKRRLLVGALHMEPDEIRGLGIGQLLGRVIESEVVETVVVSGGLLAVTAVVELALAGLVFAWAGRIGILLLLLAWFTAATFLGCFYYLRRRRWTRERMGLTNDLVERMVGHRTRLAQQRPQRWNEGEDQALDRYVTSSAAMDRVLVLLQVVAPRGWFLAGLLGLVPLFLAETGSATTLAVVVGGLVLAYRGFHHAAEGLERLSAAAVAWEQSRPFWVAANRPPAVGQSLGTLAGTGSAGNGQPLLDGRHLTFCHRPSAFNRRAALRDVQVCIRSGDRVLLQGPAGSGKSTLAAILAGCRTPTSGLLLFRGLDRATLGDRGWRRRVVWVPPFHENHILMGSLAFNVLLGRTWPPQQGDLEEAERICRALDLGPLLDRMPGGLMQLVGETGWQLSQGEKSRLFIARAVLQGAEVVILDESFAALDPQTFQRALAFVLGAVDTVVVIAHP